MKTKASIDGTALYQEFLGYQKDAVTVDIESIKYEPNVRVVPIKPDRVKRLKETLLSGVKLPPILVVQRPDGSYEKVYGSHRLQSHRELVLEGQPRFQTISAVISPRPLSGDEKISLAISEGEDAGPLGYEDRDYIMVVARLLELGRSRRYILRLLNHGVSRGTIRYAIKTAESRVRNTMQTEMRDEDAKLEEGGMKRAERIRFLHKKYCPTRKLDTVEKLLYGYKGKGVPVTGTKETVSAVMGNFARRLGQLSRVANTEIDEALDSYYTATDPTYTVPVMRGLFEGYIRAFKRAFSEIERKSKVFNDTLLQGAESKELADK